MVILLINNRRKTKDFYESILSSFAESDNIIEINTIPEAKEFIVSNLVEGGSRIDLIITNFAFGTGNPSAIELLLWIKNSHELTYYSSLLQLPSIPIILAQTDLNSTETEQLLGFDRILKSSDLDNPKRVEFVVKSTIKTWVNTMLDDYDLLRIDPYNPFLYLPIVWNNRCTILARGYSLYPRRFPFLVFRRDLEATEAAIEDFYKTVQRISGSSKPKQEKMYHRLLKKYPEFILGETYDKFFYEKNFLLNSVNSDNYEPDFIRRHTFYKFNKIANILEIKLPNDKFISGNSFHPTLSSRLVRNLSQVKDYQNYFSDRQNYDTISRVLSFTPNMTHSLLMGRSNERDIHQELLERRLREFGSSDIVLITYDDLLRKRENLLIQNSPYHIF